MREWPVLPSLHYLFDKSVLGDPLADCSMINPFNVMASLMKKFKRKRRLSSELNSRWGDTGISFPTHGSWNQWNRSPGMTTNSPGAAAQHPRTNGPRDYSSMDPTASHKHGVSNGAKSRNVHTHDSDRTESTIPKGYFDENIRHRLDRNHKPPPRGLGINGARNDMSHDQDSSTDESCDEEDDEGRDTLGEGGPLHRGCMTSDLPRTGARDHYDSYPDSASKSPPLSVTSRMRRVSTQSSTTEHSSVASRHTSYTAASSVSAPSLPPDTPRFAVNSVHAAQGAKRSASRPRHREPEPTAQQQMVPSYDELYG